MNNEEDGVKRIELVKEPQPKPKPKDKAEPAELPRGILARMDYMLHYPDSIVESIRRNQDLGMLSGAFLAATVIAAAHYGLVMGATNLLQGNDTSLTTELLYALIASVKVPALFLVTLGIVLPPIYVSGIFSGLRLGFLQVASLLLSATAIAAITLASMATVAFFFALTTRSYEFMKLLHVGIFGYAGLSAIAFLVRSFYYVADRWAGDGLRLIFVIWFALYAFVGTQLAWVLRPFIGNPGMPFMLFREQEGNFYENVFRALVNVFG